MVQREPNHTIEARRKSIEAQLWKLLDDAKSVTTVETVRQAIFQAENGDFGSFVLDMVAALRYGDIASLDDTAIQVIQDAWNYFPHSALAGSCPAELAFTAMHKYQKTKRRNSAAGG
jgi:hypothetical protein